MFDPDPPHPCGKRPSMAPEVQEEEAGAQEVVEFFFVCFALFRFIFIVFFCFFCWFIYFWFISLFGAFFFLRGEHVFSVCFGHFLDAFSLNKMVGVLGLHKKGFLVIMGCLFGRFGSERLWLTVSILLRFWNP